MSGTESDLPGPEGSAVSRSMGFFWLLTGLVGLLASGTLMVDKVKVLTDPSYVPSCNLNPVLACGSVINTAQASAFGFPNPMIGLVGFSALIALGAIAVGRVALPSWVIAGVATGSGAGVVFMHWLMFQSIFRIEALCPWCMSIWAVTIAVFVVSATGWLRLALPGRWAEVAWEFRFLVVLTWLLGVAAVITVHFWHYWSTLL